ncbi:aldose epimerase family protein [Flavobacterium sp.]|jgi:aldose 1-epimerase|uniref:aldose epimerase family protein n=1 Tax=Flavobacterium sp. TaxID=239 RepID=UPI0037BF7FFB
MKSFGLLLNGVAIDSYELNNENGMQLTVINFGATITSLKIPTKNGKIVDVVLGFDNLEAYVKSFDLESAPYLGATVGRFAGRINNGAFCLNGKTINLNNNNANHSLHGGKIGFSQKIWKVKDVNNGKNPTITLSYFSPDGEENYPGDLSVELTYTLSEENELIIEYKATTTQDTIINLTHHSYFNLDGHDATVLEQELTIDSYEILEANDQNIPTGRLLNLENKAFDFRQAKKCPKTIDTSFVLNESETENASLFSPKNNLKMSVYTNQPAVHIYVGGNCFNTIKGKENANYHSLSGICFETQNFPDAPNHQHFPTSVMKKYDKYFHKTIYKFQSF